MQCTTSDVRCNNSTSFSLCVPDTAGGSSKVVFMGAVANGTVCEGGRIGKAPGGNCSPVGNLKCQGGRGFFLCDEGMFGKFFGSSERWRWGIRADGFGYRGIGVYG